MCNVSVCHNPILGNPSRYPYWLITTTKYLPVYVCNVLSIYLSIPVLFHHYTPAPLIVFLSLLPNNTTGRGTILGNCHKLLTTIQIEVKFTSCWVVLFRHNIDFEIVGLARNQSQLLPIFITKCMIIMLFHLLRLSHLWPNKKILWRKSITLTYCVLDRAKSSMLNFPLDIEPLDKTPILILQLN